MRGLILCLTFLLSACASSWVEPSSPSGKLCVSECQIYKDQCEGSIQTSIANCANQVQTELHAYDDPQIAAETACADSAYVNSRFVGCHQRYTHCFIKCGGIVEQN